jgi:hypothetical protein
VVSLLADSAPVLGYRVVASYPHDPSAFTQGLIFIDGKLYESTGNYGRSTLRRVDLETGRVEQDIRLAPNLFGEGLMDWRGRLVQLTWRERLGIIYDAKTFERLETFQYPGEGWGLTHDGQHWIMSDGTDELRFLDPETRNVVRRLKVRAGKRPVHRLNELEYIDGAIWANVWRQRSSGANRARQRPGDSRARPDDALSSRRARESGSGVERHRPRRRDQPAVRHRQILAPALRDPGRLNAKKPGRTPGFFPRLRCRAYLASD